MTDRPSFPSLYQPIAMAHELEPFERAIRIAAEGAEPGTILWSGRADEALAAVVLAPEQSRERSLPVLQVALLALGDALTALVPPVVAVTFDWPDGLLINGGLVGGVRMAVAPEAQSEPIPDWLVIGIEVRIRGSWESEMAAERRLASLEAEGCDGIRSIDVLETFGRHFLGWIELWQEQGVEAVHRAWLARTPALGRRVRFELAGHRKEGVFSGITESGDLRLGEGQGAQIVSIESAISQPSWAA